ncbi:MAG TPA: nicotinate-nucleotide--dimethylbenzimidazole phosphoribosyltransferase [Actinomycetes bacterium]|nr:nicotinate-nucleotide--dimethylbenzimidazole phosphoribosyltransferase [Actinomycetes bacterium]
MTVDLQRFREEIARPDPALREAAEARQLQLTKPTGALGRLEELSCWVTAVQGVCPPRPIDRVRVVIFAGDHGVASAGVSAYPPEVTAQMVQNFLAGGAAVNALANTLDASVRVVDMSVSVDLSGIPTDVTRFKVRRASGNIAVEDAATREETEAAFEAGVAIADEEVDSGADLLIPGDMGIGNTTPAAALIGLLSSRDAAAVTGRGTGIDDETWIRKAAAVRDAMRRGRGVRADQLQLLATVGGPDFAAMTGFLLQAAVRRTPVVLDGLVSGACAMVAHRVAYRAAGWWQAGHRSVEPAHEYVLNRLQLEPLLDYRLRLGEGTGALLAVPLLRAAQATLADMATFGEAGVSDREHASDDAEPDAEPDDVEDPTEGVPSASEV